MKIQYQQKKLFALLAAEANHTDKDLARDNYYALIRVIVKELVKGEKMTLPEFGTFYAKLRLPARGRNIRTGLLNDPVPVITMRFSPCAKLKFYFKNVSIKKNERRERLSRAK